MSAGAREWVAQHYSWPHLAQRLAAVYNGETPATPLP